jgi:hypothetical protein
MFRFTLIALVAFGLGGRHASAQELEPRQYSNLPIGLNFLVAGYATSEGSVLFDPSIALENANVEIEGPVLGYLRSLAFGGMSGQAAIALANACLVGAADFEGQRYARDVCGPADAKLRLAMNFIGAPALRPRDFAQYRQNLVVGVSAQFSVPIGDYDPAKLANIGTNRGAVKAELGVSKAAAGWTLEAALAGTFYETNDDFFGGRTQKQEPIYSLQAHVIRSFGAGIWVALDASHYRGGKTVTEGVPDRNLQSNTRLGLTTSMPINRRHSVKVAFSTGTATRTGSDFDTLVVAWQYRWGAGL